MLFSCSVMSNSLQSHGLQHSRIPGPSLSPQSFLNFMSIDSMMLSNHLILCHPLLFLPSIFPNITLFQWVGCSHQVAKVLELHLQHNSFPWIFRVDWFDPLAVQEILKSLLQHHNLKPSLLQGSALSMVQLSHPYMTNAENNFDYMNFVSKVISLLFNVLSRFVIAFLPRSKFFFFNFMAVVSIHIDIGAQENKICCWFYFLIFICHEVMRLDAMILLFFDVEF